MDKNFLSDDNDSYLVPVRSLDEFCEEHLIRPTAAKIDVEGFEGEVICGAIRILERRRCTIICEWLGNSESHTEAQQNLARLGYLALDTKSLNPVELADQRGVGDRNVLLVHQSKARDLISRISSI